MAPTQKLINDGSAAVAEMMTAEAAGARQAWPQILAASSAGADSTAAMVATLGRAARLGERSLGHKDPGAVSAMMIIEEFARVFAV